MGAARTRGVGARHDERRAEIVEALLDLIGRGGLEAANLRDVAAAAGVSVGRVQHYFGSKDQMVHAAFTEVQRRGDDRVRRRLDAETEPTTREILRAVALGLIPADEPERRWLRVAMAFTTRAVVDPDLGDELRDGYRRFHELLASLLARGGRSDAATASVAFLALVEGLGLYVLIGRQTRDEALAIVDVELDRLLGA